MKDPIKTLDMIAEDMKKDAEDMEGKPFNGKTVSTYLAYQGAAIATLAGIIKIHLTKGSYNANT